MCTTIIGARIPLNTNRWRKGRHNILYDYSIILGCVYERGQSCLRCDDNNARHFTQQCVCVCGTWHLTDTDLSQFESHLSIDRQAGNANRSACRATKRAPLRKESALVHTVKCLVSEHQMTDNMASCAFPVPFYLPSNDSMSTFLSFSVQRKWALFTRKWWQAIKKEQHFIASLLRYVEWLKRYIHKVTMSKSTERNNSEMELLLWLHF